MLVGRDRELARLGASLEGVGAVALLGEAGVGKTALLREAVARSGRRLFEGGGLATLSWLPYLPLERALQRKLSGGDAAWVVGEVEREVGEGVLLLDDLHWVDEETRGLLPLLQGRVALLTAVRRGDPGTETALAELASLGVEPFELEPLDGESAAALVAGLRPGLSRAALARLVERAGGNPLLLEELAATGDEPSESLQLALAARLRLLGAGAREAMGLLALAGRSLERDQLGEGGAELVEAGLATCADGQVEVRHALIAETCTEQLAEAERRSLHARLTGLLSDPGEAARHHAAAGELEAALAKALVAVERATTPGERAAHLEVAASVATGPEANELRIRAAAALLEAGRASDADAVLACIDADDALVGARACFLRSHARLDRDDVPGARAAWEEGMALAAGTGGDVELDLRVEESRFARRSSPSNAIAHFVWDDEDKGALAAAESALALARERGVEHPRAHQLVGELRLVAGEDGWEPELLTAVELARAAGDLRALVDAGRALAYGYMTTGRLERGQGLLGPLAEEARELRLLGPERLFRVYRAGYHLHSGAPLPAAEQLEEVCAEALEPAVETLARYWLGQALIELGRYDEARPIVEDLLATAPRDHQSYGIVLWAAADLEFFSGRLREAVAAADECLARFPGEGPSIFVKLTRSWAALDLGLELGEPMPRPFHAMGEAAPLEEAGVRALAAGEPAEAADLLARAAELWRGRHSRGELRSLWGAGEALRCAGERDAAVEQLVAAEREATARGAQAHLSRIRRSLRLAGVRRSPARSSGERGLTGREREVLELVGAGLSNVEIARRLGVGRPTVVGLIQSASRKLGAKTRTQAAVLAERE